MIVNFEIDEDLLVEAVVESAQEGWKSDICDRIAECYGADDIAEYVSVYDIAQEIDMSDLFANVEIDYDELSDYIIEANRFQREVAALVWDKFREEFGSALTCVREEIALINKELEDRAVPFWKRWFKSGNSEEVEASES